MRHSTGVFTYRIVNIVATGEAYELRISPVWGRNQRSGPCGSAESVVRGGYASGYSGRRQRRKCGGRLICFRSVDGGAGDGSDAFVKERR